MTPPGSKIAPLVAAALVLVGVLLGVGRHAPPTLWALPLLPGDDIGAWEVQSLTRSPGKVVWWVEDGKHRGSVRALPTAAPHEQARASIPVGRLRVEDVSVDRALPDGVLQDVADRIEAWDRPWRPPFLVAEHRQIRPWERAETVATEGLALATVAGGIALLPWLVGYLVLIRRRTWATLGLLLLAQSVLVARWVPRGVWHSNHHGFERLSDLRDGVPTALANLSRLHGHGYYAVMRPVVSLTGDVPLATQGVATLAAVGCFVWFRMLLRDDRRALLSAAVLVGTPAFLRLAPTESLYVPVLLLLAVMWVAFELHLHTRQARWFVWGVAATSLLMQTRAEMLAVAPLLVGWMMLARDPAWLVHTARRPLILTTLAVGAASLVPRLVSILSQPTMSNLSRPAIDPVTDPRIALLAVLAGVAVTALPGVAFPGSWTRGRRSRKVALVAGALLVTGLWVAAVMSATGGVIGEPRIHVFLDPARTPIWLSLLAVGGAVQLRGHSPRAFAFLVGALAIGLWFYLPHYDCLSTYVRTGLATLPFFAVLAGVGIDRVGVALGRRLPPRLVWSSIAVMLLATPWFHRGWLAHRYPRQQTWDLIQETRSALPTGARVVVLGDDDIAPAREVHLARGRYGRYLGADLEVIGVDAWDGERAGTWFLWTPACHRPLLSRGSGHRAWTGEQETRWSYLAVPPTSTAHRIVVDDLEPGETWTNPRCARMLRGATAVLGPEPLDPENAGSIYEQSWGGEIGLYRL